MKTRSLLCVAICAVAFAFPALADESVPDTTSFVTGAKTITPKTLGSCDGGKTTVTVRDNGKTFAVRTVTGPDGSQYHFIDSTDGVFYGVEHADGSIVSVNKSAFVTAVRKFAPMYSKGVEEDSFTDTDCHSAAK